MSTQPERVMELLETRGIPQRERRQLLATVCGISYQSVQGWFTGDTKTIKASNLEAIAKRFDASLAWLVSGKGSMSAGQPPPTEAGDNFVLPVNLAYQRLPLISWVRAGEWAEVSDPYQPGDAEEWCNVIAKVGPRAFVLRVAGDSMTNPTGSPSAPAGSLIVVDPDIPAENGSLVVAKLNDEATFKRLVIDSGQRYLKPLNPDYKQIAVNGNCTIVGVVKQILIDL